MVTHSLRVLVDDVRLQHLEAAAAGHGLLVDDEVVEAQAAVVPPCRRPCRPVGVLARRLRIQVPVAPSHMQCNMITPLMLYARRTHSPSRSSPILPQRCYSPSVLSPPSHFSCALASLTCVCRPTRWRGSPPVPGAPRGCSRAPSSRAAPPTQHKENTYTHIHHYHKNTSSHTPLSHCRDRLSMPSHAVHVLHYRSPSAIESLCSVCHVPRCRCPHRRWPH